MRYLEVKLSAGKRVLLPVYFADVSSSRRRVTVTALTAAQFANVPTIKNPDRVTLLEEDKVSGYYGGGVLYSNAERLEPFL